MYLIVKQLLIKSEWQDVPLALRDLAVTTCTISIASTTVTLMFLILQINYFKFPCILACSYEFHAIKVLQNKPHLDLDIAEENLSKPGFKQKNFSLTTFSNSPTATID